MLTSRYRCTDAGIVRATTFPAGLAMPSWPGPWSESAAPEWREWVRQVWCLPDVADAIDVATPVLSKALTELCEDRSQPLPREIRRTTRSLMRYMLRWNSRATPFGCFAGVAPVTFGPQTAVRWGEAHVLHTRPHALDFAESLNDHLEERSVLRSLQIVLNNLGYQRGDEWVVPGRPGPTGTADIAFQRNAPLNLVLQVAAQPVLYTELVAKLSAEAPHVPVTAIENMLVELVRQRVLITSLEPATTVTDPQTYVADRLAALDQPRSLDQDSRQAIDLRLACDLTLPPGVLREAEKAATLLVELSPGRPIWRSWHAAFLERYGLGAVIPVRDLVDPDTGLGYPAGFRGSPQVPTPASERDIVLARLAQQAALTGTDLEADTVLTALNTMTSSPVPHAELRFALNAASSSDLDRGNFTLSVVSASRAAGTTIGRFLHLLSPAEQDRFTNTYRSLPTGFPGARTIQLSASPVSARLGHLARCPPIWPVLFLGEYPSEVPDSTVDLQKMAVTADTHRLYLVSSSDGQVLEPVVLNAVDLRHHAHPLVRFLCEVSTGLLAPVMPFSWGRIASTFPFLPRIRSGRTILSPPRWIITASDLPGAAASNEVWAEAFAQHSENLRIPRLVLLGDDDVRIRLDLHEPAHLDILRNDLDKARTAVLTDTDSDYRWLHGRAHEIVLTLAATEPPRRPARPIRAEPRPTTRHTPGASTWLHVNLWTSPGRQTDLLTRHLPHILEERSHGPTESWWYIRYENPSPHLRLRLKLHSPDVYGDAVNMVGRWADPLIARHQLRDITFEAYRPETGRFGSGALLAAAETVFAADSAVAVSQLASGHDLTPITAASLIDLAIGLLGEDGLHWLVEHLEHGKGPRLPKNLLDQVNRRHTTPAALTERRHRTLKAYRALLAPADTDAALADLLHLHHTRMIGVSEKSEALCLRLARTVAQTRLHIGRSPSM